MVLFPCSNLLSGLLLHKNMNIICFSLTSFAAALKCQLDRDKTKGKAAKVEKGKYSCVLHKTLTIIEQSCGASIITGTELLLEYMALLFIHLCIA